MHKFFSIIFICQWRPVKLILDLFDLNGLILIVISRTFLLIWNILQLCFWWWLLKGGLIYELGPKYAEQDNSLLYKLWLLRQYPSCGSIRRRYCKMRWSWFSTICIDFYAVRSSPILSSFWAIIEPSGPILWPLHAWVVISLPSQMAQNDTFIQFSPGHIDGAYSLFLLKLLCFFEALEGWLVLILFLMKIGLGIEGQGFNHIFFFIIAGDHVAVCFDLLQQFGYSSEIIWLWGELLLPSYWIHFSFLSSCIWTRL